MTKFPLVRLFHWAVCLVVVASIGAGLWISGSPTTERQRALDRQRIEHLSQISYAIDSYVNTHTSKLPTTLEQVAQSQAGTYISTLRDPATNESYEYNAISTSTYELCATFALPLSSDEQLTLPTPRTVNGLNMTWQHGAGRTCFLLQANYQPTLSPIELKPLQ